MFVVRVVLPGMGGKPFSCDPRKELGKGIGAAESDWMHIITEGNGPNAQ